VASVLRFIRRHVASGVDDPDWYEEQFSFLLGRVVRAEQALAQLPDRIERVRRSKRHELVRRLGWATDFMHSNLHREMSLGDIAQAAHLSQYHFLRVFRQVHGVTPMTYLRNQRTQRALALLHSTRLDISQIASQVGLSRLSPRARDRAKLARLWRSSLQQASPRARGTSTSILRLV
jgi:AraC family transcriptional regulator